MLVKQQIFENNEDRGTIDFDDLWKTTARWPPLHECNVIGVIIRTIEWGLRKCVCNWSMMHNFKVIQRQSWKFEVSRFLTRFPLFVRVWDFELMPREAWTMDGKMGESLHPQQTHVAWQVWTGSLVHCPKIESEIRKFEMSNLFEMLWSLQLKIIAKCL